MLSQILFNRPGLSSGALKFAHDAINACEEKEQKKNNTIHSTNAEIEQAPLSNAWKFRGNYISQSQREIAENCRL